MEFFKINQLMRANSADLSADCATIFQAWISNSMDIALAWHCNVWLSQDVTRNLISRLWGLLSYKKINACTMKWWSSWTFFDEYSSTTNLFKNFIVKLRISIIEYFNLYFFISLSHKLNRCIDRLMLLSIIDTLMSGKQLILMN